MSSSNQETTSKPIPGLKLLSEESKQRIRDLMAKYPKARSAILPALHVVQEQLGWVPEEAQEEVAEMFGMPPAEVRSLVTFYYMYHRQPVGKYVLKVCRSISCWLRNSEGVEHALCHHLGVKPGEMTEDGMFTVVHGECLAACVGAPVLQVNDRFVENCDPEKMPELIERLRRGDPRYPAAAESWQRPEEGHS
jgi:NADH-quinone oxidoreductase subunit E